MLLFLVSFWRLVFDIVWCCILELVISTYFLSNILMGEKCLIYINLCTFHVKKNSARLQWYSCARYKAPGPLVYVFKIIQKQISNNRLNLSCNYIREHKKIPIPLDFLIWLPTNSAEKLSGQFSFRNIFHSLRHYFYIEQSFIQYLGFNF